MASIATRKNSKGETTWRVGYRDGGKLRWTPTIYSAEGAVEMRDLIERQDPETALAILAKRRGAAEGTLLLRDVLDRYLASLESHAAKGTAPEYRRTAERTWLPALGPLPVAAITRPDVERWIAKQRTTETVRSAARRKKIAEWNAANPRARQPMPEPQTYSAKSIKNAHTILAQTLTYAESTLGAIPSNPAKGARLPSDDEQIEREIFTREEFQAFLAAMQPTYRALTAFLVVSACRIGEATALQIRDLDLDAGAVEIRRAWKRGERTGDGHRYLGAAKSRRAHRTILIPPTLVEWLREITDGRAGDEFVFRAVRGGPVRPQNFRSRQWPKALEAAGITKRLTPHSLRHTSGSWLLMDGVAPQVVQHRLGHESLDTTSRVYAHLLQDAQLPAVARMASVVSERREIEG